MPVKDELEGLSPRERANLKAQRIAEAIPAMSRPFQRNNVRWTISEFGTVDLGSVKGLRLVATARTMPTGPTLFTDREFVFINPPIMVPDGEEANPDYDPANPVSGPTRTVYREDLAEAARQMLASQL